MVLVAIVLASLRANCAAAAILNRSCQFRNFHAKRLDVGRHVVEHDVDTLELRLDRFCAVE